jgi:polyphenol oxidase
MTDKQFPGSFYSIAGGGNRIFAGKKSNANLAKHMGDQTSVVSARSNLAAQLGCQIQWLRQVHGVEVFDADADLLRESPVPFQDPVADAAFTGRPNVAIAILTADCLPVMFADVHGRFVAGAHAGWRGLANGVLDRTVKAFMSRGIASHDIRAFFGPCIGRAAFEVGSEVREVFLDLALPKEQSATINAFAHSPNDGKWLGNLCALAALRLERFGVVVEHQTLSHSSHFCTYSNPKEFFSYRFHCHHPQVLDGRQATLIWRPQ